MWLGVNIAPFSVEGKCGRNFRRSRQHTKGLSVLSRKKCMIMEEIFFCLLVLEDDILFASPFL